MSMVRPLAPLRSEHSINCEHFRMSKKKLINLGKLVRDERLKWQDGHLLAPGAFRDFQKLCDEAFHLLRGKYYRPADLVAEFARDRRLRPADRFGNRADRMAHSLGQTNLFSFVIRQMRIASHGNTP